MQNNSNLEFTRKPLPDVYNVEFFYDKNVEFSNDELGITGNYNSNSGKVEVKLPFEKGAYLLFLNYVGKQLMFSKQPTESENLPLPLDGWIKKQITSDEDIPAECHNFCHYDELNQILTVTLTVPYDYALNYGTQPWCNSIYLQFMTGHRWRFLDRVTGG